MQGKGDACEHCDQLHCLTRNAKNISRKYLLSDCARHKKSIAEDRRRLRQAQELAAQGRGSDTEIAHLTPGELVIPRALQSPALMNALQRAAAAHNIPLAMLSVGNARNRINPNTGAPEFWLGALSRPFSSLGDPDAPRQTDLPATPGARRSRLRSNDIWSG